MASNLDFFIELFNLEMFDSDTILEQIDSFGPRIGILYRFLAIRFSIEAILYRQNRNRNGQAIKQFGVLKLTIFF